MIVIRKEKGFLKHKMTRFPIFILLLVLSLLFACSTPSWFPIKKGPSPKAKTKELQQKEVTIIDGEEYVKVANPKASEGGDQPKLLYVPVGEYLSKKGNFAVSATRKDEGKKDFSASSTQPSSSSPEKEIPLVSTSVSPFADLKKKVLMTHFDDRTTDANELFGDWVAEKLVNEINRRSNRILFVDYQLVKDLLERRGVALTGLETAETLHLLNEVFGIQALVVGQLSGPYVFATKSDKDTTASAIIKIETRIVDTLSGKTLKTLSSSNRILASKEKGDFPEERAKVKAIDLAINGISDTLSGELDSLDWFCRVAKVDGEEIYINAGRLTGLKVGDVMEVFRPGGVGERGETRGKIQISAFLGIDAAMGRLIDGKKPEVSDILKLAKKQRNLISVPGYLISPSDLV